LVAAIEGHSWKLVFDSDTLYVPKKNKIYLIGYEKKDLRQLGVVFGMTLCG
jgi:hypothetical protein